MRRALAKSITAIGISLATFLTVATGPAQANDFDNMFDPRACEDQYHSGKFAFHIFYNSNLGGSYRNLGYAVYDFGAVTAGGSDSSYQPLKFCLFGASNPWPGSLQSIKNNAASARNDHETYLARVYYNHGYKGVYDQLNPLESRAKFRNVYNENASFKWVSP
ncbi:hypothetical protein [Streptomyces sp. NPDC057280]|uniref:hypothetical protein n=1 Tax=Streptomyces sp. NPDC057280 TaxID=3346081 RepID=UPI00362CAA44